MKISVYRLLALAVVAASLIGAGCGGDDDETTSSTASTPTTGATGVVGGSLTKEQFIDEADAICAAGDQEIEAAAGQFGGEAPQGQALVDFTEDIVLPSIQAQLDAISALPVPEGEEEAVDELLTALQEALDALADDPEQLADGSQFQEVNQLAEDFGLTNCGGGSE